VLSIIHFHQQAFTPGRSVWRPSAGSGVGNSFRRPICGRPVTPHGPLCPAPALSPTVLTSPGPRVYPHARWSFDDLMRDFCARRSTLVSDGSSPMEVKGSLRNRGRVTSFQRLFSDACGTNFQRLWQHKWSPTQCWSTAYGPQVNMPPIAETPLNRSRFLAEVEESTTDGRFKTFCMALLGLLRLMRLLTMRHSAHTHPTPDW
jgi:hypothetical protein